MPKRRRPYRVYTPEQKAQIVQDYLSSGESMYAAAKRLGVCYVNLRRWVSRADQWKTPIAASPSLEDPQAGIDPLPATQTVTTTSGELEDLQRTNEELTQELSLCKQALAHFAQKCFVLASKQAA